MKTKNEKSNRADSGNYIKKKKELDEFLALRDICVIPLKKYIKKFDSHLRKKYQLRKRQRFMIFAHLKDKPYRVILNVYTSKMDGTFDKIEFPLNVHEQQ